MGEVKRLEKLRSQAISAACTKNRIIKTAAGTGYADKTGHGPREWRISMAR